MCNNVLCRQSHLINNQRKRTAFRTLLLMLVGLGLFAGSSVACGYAFSRVVPAKVTVIPVVIKECAKGKPA